VYPAGFVWMYSGLYWLTGSDPRGDGSNIFLAQVLFAGLYLLTIAVALRIYYDTK
jgi:alpha-1,3-mannosyltransferase